jgi:hypothetical protein
MPQRRRFPRISSEQPVRVRRLGAGAVEEFASTKVIGLGGCSFGSTQTFGVGSLVELQIPLRGGVVSADGRVVYELPQAGGEIEVGVEFLRVAARHLARIRALTAGGG